jgi:tetratricopeptide (TPR) repeat protein
MIHEKPPEVLAVLQQTENAYLQGDADNILNLIASYKGSQEESPLRLYKTLAQIMQGNPELAYATALSLCSTDHRFSPVFLQIANLLVSGKNQQEAERFFSAGFKLWPEMDLGLVDFALCLRDTGQFHEAISFFNKEIKLRGSFPVEFMVANTYLLLNDQSTFRKSLQSAISGIDRNRYSYVIDQSVADDIYNVIRYCENNGMAREAAILRNNSKLGLMSKLFTENRSPEPAR